ncbi:Ig-like domain-containing protein [Microscilla marina]|uniref:Vcbs, putative n=1 Tax=Microscilla marina ATCC 23134 TaxID=313606 RepID=A1ZSK4_MICM2|nr:Ig-like domain-containing protein [Microscilla marina]EAY26584.1 vcbs, putative [Microscilla marina ATCC 23134]
MINTKYQFLPAFVLVALLGLIASCNRIDKDINPATSQGNTPAIATNDVAQAFPGSSVVIDLIKNDKITTSSNVSLLQGYLKRGSAKFIKQGMVLYTPNDSTGTDTLAYTVCPPGQPCDTAAVKITISADSITRPCFGAVPDIAQTTLGKSVEVFVLQNDRLCDSTASDTSNLKKVVEIVESPKNGSANVTVGGISLTYLPQSGFKGVDQLIYGVRNASTNNYLGYGVVTIFVGDSTVNPQDTTTHCVPKAMNDNYTISGDSLPANGKYVYLNVLSNDTLCNDSLNKIILNNGGLNTPPVFENNQLKVKLYPSDSTVILQYGLTKNGNTVSQATVSIRIQKPCQLQAVSDSAQVSNVPPSGQWMTIDVLANDHLCSVAASNISKNIVQQNTNAYFEGNNLKVFVDTSKQTFTVTYKITNTSNGQTSQTDLVIRRN